MNDFIEYLVKNLVDHPDDVNVEIYDGQKSTIVEVKVSDEDVAKIVGRQGRTIQALRTIALTVGSRFNKRVRLELIH